MTQSAHWIFQCIQKNSLQMLLRLCNEFFYFIPIKHLEGLEERAIASVF